MSMNLLPNHRTRAATTVGNWPDAGPGLAHTAPLQRTASWHSWGGGPFLSFLYHALSPTGRNLRTLCSRLGTYTYREALESVSELLTPCPCLSLLT